MSRSGRIAGRDDQAERDRQQLKFPAGVEAVRVDHEPDIQTSDGQAVPQVVAVELNHFDPYVRPSAAEPAHRVGQEASRHRGLDAEPDRGAAVASAPYFCAGPLRTFGQLARPRKQPAPGIGDPHRLAGAAFEERHTQLALELLDACAQWWLRDAQTLRGTAKVPLVGYGQEVAQVAEVHDRQSTLSVSDRVGKQGLRFAVVARHNQRSHHPRGQARRERVLDTASKAFADRGFRGAALAAIAAESETSLTGVLHHFQSKDRLLQAVIEHHEKQAAERFIKRLDSASLRDALLCVVEDNDRDPAPVQLFLVLATEAIDAAHPAQEYFVNRYRDAREFFAAAFEREQAEGRVRSDVEPHRLGQMLVAVMDGLLLQRLLKHDVDYVEALASFFDSISAAGEADGSNFSGCSGS
jgi:AcrR family transcriptional regulator